MKIAVGVLLSLITVASANATLTTTVRDSKGQLLDTDQRGAFDYCSGLNLLVPKVRELAEWAVLNGATGIRETKFPNVEPHTNSNFDQELETNRNEGYDAVWKNKDQMGSGGVNFYYNGKGFNPVANETGWYYRSSSKIWIGGPAYYVLNSTTGELNWEDPVLHPLKRLTLKCSDQ